MIAAHDVSGLVLAGGQGRRMQHPGLPVREKGLMLLHGRPLVAWAVQGMPPGLARQYISANRHTDEYARYGEVVTDEPALGRDLGPLAGVATVLDGMATQWLYVAPVDVPCPPAEIFECLAGYLVRHGGNLAYAHGERPQPLFMLLHQRLRHSLRSYLQQGMRQVQGWQAHHGHAVRIDGRDHAFFNINTPDDLDLAHQRIGIPCRS